MTLERKLFIGLEDVEAVCFECSYCHSRFSKSNDPNVKVIVPSVCMACGTNFPSEESSDVSRFVSALQTLRAKKVIGCKVVLEIEAGKMSEG
jgi:hypothetical protein